LGRLPDLSSFLVLLSARQTELDSCFSSSSFLLDLRVRAVNPNFFRKEVLEVNELELAARWRIMVASEIEP
jgi:hypothetical protein